MFSGQLWKRVKIIKFKNQEQFQVLLSHWLETNILQDGIGKYLIKLITSISRYEAVMFVNSSLLHVLNQNYCLFFMTWTPGIHFKAYIKSFKIASKNLIYEAIFMLFMTINGLYFLGLSTVFEMWQSQYS